MQIIAPHLAEGPLDSRRSTVAAVSHGAAKHEHLPVREGLHRARNVVPSRRTQSRATFRPRHGLRVKNVDVLCGGNRKASEAHRESMRRREGTVP